MKRFVYYKRFQPIFNQSDEMGGPVMVDGEGRWDREKEGGSGCGGGGGGGGASRGSCKHSSGTINSTLIKALGGRG